MSEKLYNNYTLEELADLGSEAFSDVQVDFGASINRKSWLACAEIIAETLTKPIRVSEEFPKEYEPVLIKGGLAHYEGFHDGWHKWFSHENQRLIQWVVTEWMPYPEALK